VARIYLSSTFQDLKDHREEVAKGLRRLRHEVIGMEDYVADGSRPLAKCLRDITGDAAQNLPPCDLYVGLFAKRYGYVPDEPANPDKWSITEAEYRTALRTLGAGQCLIFLLDPKTPWTEEFMDVATGENGAGAKIKALREELGKTHTVSFFKAPSDLANVVTSAVTLWQPAPSETKEPVGPTTRPRLQREVTFGALLAYAGPDKDPAAAFANELKKAALTTLLAPDALFAETEAEFSDLEPLAIKCHAALVWLSPAGLAQLTSRPAEVARALEVLETRTGWLVGLLAGVKPDEVPAGWPFTKLVDATAAGAASQVVATMAGRPTQPGLPTIGVPCVVIAMTRDEAVALLEHSDVLQGELGPERYKQFVDLKAALERAGGPAARYGAGRREWKPFGGATVRDIGIDIAKRLNGRRAARGAQRRQIKLQYYPFDGWLDRAHPELRPVYQQIALTGCVALVDELSLFHGAIAEACATFVAMGQVAVVTVSPLDDSRSPLNQLLETRARKQLAGAFDRFELDLDPACEFRVGEERRLRRWLHLSLPGTVDNVTQLRADPSKLESFENDVGPERRRGVDGLIYPHAPIK
jgi:hypothetical protein